MEKQQTLGARIEWVDIARGIAIIAMVAGHTSIPLWLSKYIWSFHMPLFFVVSGLFFNPAKYASFKDLFIKRIFTLFIPYCFFSIIVFIGYYGTEYFRPYELYYGWEGYALWFVPVLFLTELAFYPLSRLRSNLIIVAILFCAFFGCLLSKYGIELPFKVETVPTALLFMGAGFMGKGWILTHKPNWWIVVVVGVITATLSQLLPKFSIIKITSEMPILSLCNALLGIYFVFCLSKLLSSFKQRLIVRFIDYFGRNSLYVMGFSQILNYWILTLLGHLHLGLVELPLRYFLLFTAMYAISWGLPKYVPFLVGKFGKSNRTQRDVTSE